MMSASRPPPSSMMNTTLTQGQSITRLCFVAWLETKDFHNIANDAWSSPLRTVLHHVDDMGDTGDSSTHHLRFSTAQRGSSKVPRDVPLLRLHHRHIWAKQFMALGDAIIVAQRPSSLSPRDMGGALITTCIASHADDCGEEEYHTAANTVDQGFSKTTDPTRREVEHRGTHNVGE